MKDLLRRLKDENTLLLVQLGAKDEEINRLQEEETDDANLESQLEEVRRKEEVLKDQLEKKDEALQRQLERTRLKEEDLKEQLEEKDKAYQKLEVEVVELKKKAEQSEAHVKTSSSILDEILESQRSPFDKIGLGYGKTKKETEEEPSCSLFAPSILAQKKEEMRS